MVTIEGKEYPSHKEFFEKYPWKVKEFKRINEPLLFARYLEHCADCGLRWHPAIMTLDHVNRDGYHTSTGKRVHPSSMVEYPPKLFRAELKKCEAVCMNCHAMREFVRDGNLKKEKYLAFGTTALLSQDIIAKT
ncbi:MAG TPA: hypothetical protein VF466_05470 [Candidatus Saccharimonadales bacterium]